MTFHDDLPYTTKQFTINLTDVTLTTWLLWSNKFQASLYNDQQIQSEIKDFLRELEISWSFILPNAPHFRSLWEAAVKSVKYHMTRIVDKAHLIFEEMQTTFCEIEAIFNSRPFLPLSADSNDLAYLSPGHFLVGTTLNGLLCVDLSDVNNENKLLRWQRVERTRQHFWRR